MYEKMFDKNQHLFMIKKKSTQPTYNEGNVLRVTKGIFEKHSPYTVFNNERVNAFSEDQNKKRISTLVTSAQRYTGGSTQVS